MHDPRFAPPPPHHARAESARDGEGFGITLAGSEGESPVHAWRDHPQHAQTRRGDEWYRRFEARVARVERACGRDRGDA